MNNEPKSEISGTEAAQMVVTASTLAILVNVPLTGM